jgi:hypothetical protein
MKSPKKAPANIDPHPLIAGIIQNESELTALVGFLGKPQPDSTVKLYLDWSLNNYCKIPVASIVAKAPVDASDANSPSIVWVRSSATLEFVTIRKTTGGADYIQGEIQKRHLPLATGQESNVSLMGPSTWTCPRPTLDNCGTSPMWCSPSVMVYCPQ